MARKKEPDLELKNRDRIIQITKQLFYKNGIENTTMNDIAKEVGMSKSTLYVYFKNKDEVKNYLSLEAMEYLSEQFNLYLAQCDQSTYEQFMQLCNILVSFYDQYPVVFEMLVREICIEKERLEKDQILNQIYQTGESINQLLIQTIGTKVNVTDSKELFLILFGTWGKVYGVILLAQQKEKYIKEQSGLSKEEFLKWNFEALYQSIQWREE